MKIVVMPITVVKIVVIRGHDAAQPDVHDDHHDREIFTTITTTA